MSDKYCQFSSRYKCCDTATCKSVFHNDMIEQKLNQTLNWVFRGGYMGTRQGVGGGGGGAVLVCAPPALK